eukprot:GEMP01046378.1.p1 GENE.GEMP01046378.1~~GEMP01046378.1.p1  ORF type:complete len:440 (+),score=74.86 GEMP01046378.1:113-1432(+)
MFLSKENAKDVFEDDLNGNVFPSRNVENDNASAACASVLRKKMQSQHEAFIRKRNSTNEFGRSMSCNMVMSTDISGSELTESHFPSPPDAGVALCSVSKSQSLILRNSITSSTDGAVVAPFSSEDSELELEQRRQTRVDDLKERGLATVFDPSPPITPLYSAELRKMNKEQLKAFLMNPLPKGVMLECRINREKSGFSKFYPKFTFETDSGVFLSSSKKRTNNKTSNYLISLDPNDLNRQGDAYIGKVRANFLGSEFTGFGPGANPMKGRNEASGDIIASRDDNIREELVGIQYSSSLFGKKPRGPRKMSIVMPTVTNAGQRVSCRARNPQTEGLLALVENHSQNTAAPGTPQLVTTYVNKPPKWNDQIGAFVLNFNKRVTQASVKNFQLIRSDDPDSVYLQFGRVARDTFTIDFRYPVSPFQAFCIALSSFDYKLCCE